MSIIIPGNTLAAGGFNVDNSCRFDDDAKLTRTFGSGGSVVKWTWSSWFKVSYIGGNEQVFFSSFTDTSNFSYIKINGNNKLEFRAKTSGSTILRYTLARRFRDPSAFMHLVVALDTTDGTAGDRIKIWINGVRETVFDASTAPAEDAVTLMNSAAAHAIGYAGDGTDYFQGYMSQVCFVDNVQYDADQFGEFDEDSGTWKAIDVSGLTFGATSFFLDFADSGDLGDDESGNSNDWTEVNLAATDQSLDTCTNNFATFNPLVKPVAAVPLSEGNLRGVFPGSWTALPANFGVTKGKWYWEAKNVTSGQNAFMGVVTENQPWDASTPYNETTGVVLYGPGGRKTVDNTSNDGFFATLSSGQIVGVALDLDSSTKTIQFSVNGTNTPNSTPVDLPSTFDDVFIFPYFIGNSSSATSNWELNFGSPAYAISSGNADGNGYGDFEYAVPSGFLALCTKNLSAVNS